MLQPGPTQVLFGGGVSFLLALCFFELDWLYLESVFKAFPVLATPFAGAEVIGPTLRFVSIRRMIEIGVRKRLVFSAFHSLGLILKNPDFSDTL